MDGTTDYRLTSDQLRENCLPQELEAYPYYPEGIHIPVGDDYYVIVTEPWEAPPEHSDPSVWCTLGVYSCDGRDGGTMIDLKRETELEGAVIWLLTAIRHDELWLDEACATIDRWFVEGKG